MTGNEFGSDDKTYFLEITEKEWKYKKKIEKLLAGHQKIQPKRPKEAVDQKRTYMGLV